MSIMTSPEMSEDVQSPEQAKAALFHQAFPLLQERIKGSREISSVERNAAAFLVDRKWRPDIQPENVLQELFGIEEAMSVEEARLAAHNAVYAAHQEEIGKKKADCGGNTIALTQLDARKRFDEIVHAQGLQQHRQTGEIVLGAVGPDLVPTWVK